mgnify:CR=1 FL=1
MQWTNHTTFNFKVGLARSSKGYLVTYVKEYAQKEKKDVEMVGDNGYFKKFGHFRGFDKYVVRAKIFFGFLYPWITLKDFMGIQN